MGKLVIRSTFAIHSKLAMCAVFPFVFVLPWFQFLQALRTPLQIRHSTQGGGDMIKF